jgi:hypothetical protein
MLFFQIEKQNPSSGYLNTSTCKPVEKQRPLSCKAANISFDITN